MGLKFIIDVTPGDHTTETDLTRMREGIRITLSSAVNHVARDIFPELTFDFYGPAPGGDQE